MNLVGLARQGEQRRAGSGPCTERKRNIPHFYRSIEIGFGQALTVRAERDPIHKTGFT